MNASRKVRSGAFQTGAFTCPPLAACAARTALRRTVRAHPASMPTVGASSAQTGLTRSSGNSASGPYLASTRPRAWLPCCRHAGLAGRSCPCALLASIAACSARWPWAALTVTSSRTTGAAGSGVAFSTIRRRPFGVSTGARNSRSTYRVTIASERADLGQDAAQQDERAALVFHAEHVAPDHRDRGVDHDTPGGSTVRSRSAPTASHRRSPLRSSSLPTARQPR